MAALLLARRAGDHRAAQGGGGGHAGSYVSLPVRIIAGLNEIARQQRNACRLVGTATL
jgi:hypothetical protein